MKFYEAFDLSGEERGLFAGSGLVGRQLHNEE